MNRSRLSKFAATAISCVFFSLAVHAGNDPSSDASAAQPTKQEREKMAKLHENMAACLRSDKTLRECHEAARKECQDELGDRCRDMMRAMMGMEHRMNKHRENGGDDSHPHQ